MNKYLEMKKRHQEDINNFPMFFAFSNKQFSEGMAKLGLTENDTDKIYRIVAGGYIRKSDSPKLNELLDRHIEEMEKAMTEPDFAFEAFRYELANHEYGYTGDETDALDALGLTVEEVNSDPMLSGQLKRAKNECLNGK